MVLLVVWPVYASAVSCVPYWQLCSSWLGSLPCWMSWLQDGLRQPWLGSPPRGLHPLASWRRFVLMVMVKSKGPCGGTQGLLRSRHGSGTPSLPLHPIGQSKSQGSPASRGGEIDSASCGRSCKVALQRTIYHRVIQRQKLFYLCAR